MKIYGNLETMCFITLSDLFAVYKSGTNLQSVVQINSGVERELLNVSKKSIYIYIYIYIYIHGVRLR
jgi:hypothetical protein